MRVDREHQLYTKLASYLQKKYPFLVYRFDIAADLKLTKGQATKIKRLHPLRGYPDLLIPVVKANFPSVEEYKGYLEKGRDLRNYWKDKGIKPFYGGLYLELKAEGNSPFKKDGGLKKDDHLAEQAFMLDWLKKQGYEARFATGFDEAVQIIDDYLKDTIVNRI